MQTYDPHQSFEISFAKLLNDAYQSLKVARLGGDQLTIDLAENAVNDILDKMLRLSRVTKEAA